jgi:diamine N-acetyltransferase
VKINVYLRPLQVSDAYTSWSWRNDPDIWAFTGSRPTKHITEEIEVEWIRSAVSDRASKRFAICVTETEEYIGNIQLTNITPNTAQLHIFIGNKSFWGRGVASQATNLLLEWAWQALPISSIYLSVDQRNLAAITAYTKNGFECLSRSKNISSMQMVIKKPVNNV